MFLMDRPSVQAGDRWTRRAFNARQRQLATLRSLKSYASPDRYRRAVADLNRLVAMAAANTSARLSLTNYSDSLLTPTNSSDLQQSFENPAANPFYNYFTTRLNRLLADRQPAQVAVSLNYLSQALCAFAMLGYLRQGWPGLTLLLGGGLVTSWMRQPGWHNPFTGMVDELICGPGEGPLLQRAGVVPLDPFAHYPPAYDALPLADYLAPEVILPYSAARGCYWRRCRFCPERAEGNPYHAVPTETVLHELKQLCERTGAGLIHLLDNAIQPALLNALIQSPPSRPWYGFARFSPQLADADYCRALKQANCRMLKLGLESGDQDVLDQEHKGIDLTVASKVLQHLHAAGIGTYIYLLFGTPSETEGRARRTLDFAVRHHKSIDFLNLAVFNLPIHATRTLRLRPHSSGDLSLYTDFEHPHGWQRFRVRQFLDREFRRHPAIQPILRRDPMLFTSSHAPFFLRHQMPNQELNQAIQPLPSTSSA